MGTQDPDRSHRQSTWLPRPWLPGFVLDRRRRAPQSLPSSSRRPSWHIAASTARSPTRPRTRAARAGVFRTTAPSLVAAGCPSVQGDRHECVSAGGDRCVGCCGRRSRSKEANHPHPRPLTSRRRMNLERSASGVIALRVHASGTDSMLSSARTSSLYRHRCERSTLAGAPSARSAATRARPRSAQRGADDAAARAALGECAHAHHVGRAAGRREAQGATPSRPRTRMRSADARSGSPACITLASSVVGRVAVRVPRRAKR